MQKKTKIENLINYKKGRGTRNFLIRSLLVLPALGWTFILSNQVGMTLIIIVMGLILSFSFSDQIKKW